MGEEALFIFLFLLRYIASRVEVDTNEVGLDWFGWDGYISVSFSLHVCTSLWGAKQLRQA